MIKLFFPPPSFPLCSLSEICWEDKLQPGRWWQLDSIFPVCRQWPFVYQDSHAELTARLLVCVRRQVAGPPLTRCTCNWILSSCGFWKVWTSSCNRWEPDLTYSHNRKPWTLIFRVHYCKHTHRSLTRKLVSLHSKDTMHAVQPHAQVLISQGRLGHIMALQGSLVDNKFKNANGRSRKTENFPIKWM